MLWRDVLDFLEHPDDALRAIARGETEAARTEDRAEKELLEIAAQVRELDAQEERLLDANLRNLYSPTVVEKKARRIRAERARLERRAEEVRAARAKAVRAAEESERVRRLLRSLKGLAEQASGEQRKRAAIVRTVTRGVTATRHGDSLRLVVRYAFQAPARLGAEADASAVVASRTASPSAATRYTPGIRRTHALALRSPTAALLMASDFDH